MGWAFRWILQRSFYLPFILIRKIYNRDSIHVTDSSRDKILRINTQKGLSITLENTLNVIDIDIDKILNQYVIETNIYTNVFVKNNKPYISDPNGFQPHGILSWHLKNM